MCGYYYYLPAIFIYGDLKHCAFHTEIDKKYSPQEGSFYSALPSSSGNLVMKYSCGMAVMYAPAFFMAHILAEPLGFEADGFSRIYQFAISFWSVLWAFVGLWYLRKVLLKLGFSEGVTATVLLVYVLATNYLEYAGVSSPQTHSYIFTLYAILIWHIIRFYEAPNMRSAVSIGLCMGLSILARPTELIIVAIPVFWQVFDLKSGLARLQVIKTHFFKYAVAGALVVGIGLIQLLYWKSTAGHFIYNSYGAGDWMEWGSPHIMDGLFSARRGWLVYTPIMVFALLGFIPLYKHHRSYFLTLFAFTVLFIYVSFAHNIWWYGGSLGQRQMIQLYPLLALPLAALLTELYKRTFSRVLFAVVAVVCVYLNGWMMYQAHGGSIWADDMTPQFLRRTYGRLEVPLETFKLLDTEYDFTGERRDVVVVYQNDFEKDSSDYIDFQNSIHGKRALFVDETHGFTPPYNIEASSVQGKKWLRVDANYRSFSREWNSWLMPQSIIEFKKGDEVIATNIIRPHRLLQADNDQRHIWFDAKVPQKNFDRVVFRVWNANSPKKLVIDDVKVAVFND